MSEQSAEQQVRSRAHIALRDAAEDEVAHYQRAINNNRAYLRTLKKRVQADGKEGHGERVD